MEARAIVVGGCRVVVACCSVGTSCDFKFVAYTVTVCIHEAVAVAVVASIGIGARAVFVGCVRVVVTRRGVLTACDFKFVAYAVAIRIIEAVAIAVVASIGIRA